MEKIKKRICFFSAGFAFNRLNRMRFYEKALPKDTQIYLFTTNRWHGKENAYQFEWSGLKRTKIIIADYNWKLPITLRSFCKRNKIDRLVNIGNRASVALFFYASLFTNTEYIFNMMGWIPKENELFKPIIKRQLWDYFFYYLFAFFAKRTTSVDRGVYLRYNSADIPITQRILFGKKKNFIFLPAPLDTDVFYTKDKAKVRKKLKLPKDKKIVLFVGRINENKCGDVLIELIKQNKDILFIVIGRSMIPEFDKLKADNLIYYNKKNPEELVDFYNASDLSFLLMRLRAGGLGQTVQESLACGLPAIVRDLEGVIKTKAMLKIPPQGARHTKLIYSKDYAVKESNKVLRDFFNKPKKERDEISKIAREYAMKNCSHKVWAEPHIKGYLY